MQVDIKRGLSILLLASAMLLGCGSKRKEDQFVSALVQIRQEYKHGSDKAWTFPHLDRNASKETKRLQVAEDIEAESKRVATLATKLRTIDTPPRFVNLRDAYLHLLDGDAMIEGEYARAAKEGNDSRVDQLGFELARSEFEASAKIVDLEVSLKLATAKEKEDFAAAKAKFEMLAKEHVTAK